MIHSWSSFYKWLNFTSFGTVLVQLSLGTSPNESVLLGHVRWRTILDCGPVTEVVLLYPLKYFIFSLRPKSFFFWDREDFGPIKYDSSCQVRFGPLTRLRGNYFRFGEVNKDSLDSLSLKAPLQSLLNSIAFNKNLWFLIYLPIQAKLYPWLGPNH